MPRFLYSYHSNLYYPINIHLWWTVLFSFPTFCGFNSSHICALHTLYGTNNNVCSVIVCTQTLPLPWKGEVVSDTHYMVPYSGGGVWIREWGFWFNSKGIKCMSWIWIMHRIRILNRVRIGFQEFLNYTWENKRKNRRKGQSKYKTIRFSLDNPRKRTVSKRKCKLDK